MATCFLGCVRIRSGAMPSSQEAPARMAECRVVRCAIYARKSTEEGLAQPFNSLDAQRESAEAYISSQRDKGWTVLERRYEDGGYTGANLDRPALQALLQDIESGQIDCVVVYKVDRLSRSLLEFERELIAERTRDKMRAARRKGKWLGGYPVLGYDVDPQVGGLKINAAEAERARFIFE